MKLNVLFGFLFFLIVVTLLVLYWFVPFSDITFRLQGFDNTNFSISNSSSDFQFYPLMRFPNKEISYKIVNCTLQKQDDMRLAFDILENKTILDFYEIEIGEEIYVTCDNRQKIEEGMFIAGEGGPTKVLKTDIFNVITEGKILLLKQSTCYQPNVAIHELLHVLGFNHSNNQGNIMYPVTNCNQEIGQDVLNLINEIYSIDTLPDLAFENSSANLKGKYLNLIVSLRNNGLKESEKAQLEIFVEEDLIKTLSLNELEIGEGVKITLENIFVPKISVDEIKLVINSDFEELNLQNNEIYFVV